MTTTDQLLDIPAVSRRLGCSTGKARQIIREGSIPVIRVGRSIRVRASDVEGWLAAQEPAHKTYPGSTEDIMSSEELSDRLGISLNKVYRLAAADDLPIPVIRLGGRTVFSRHAYNAFITRQKDPSPSVQ